MKVSYVVAGLGLAYILYGQNVPEFEKRVTEFTLPNGLHFIVAERHDWPVVAFHSVVKVGSVDDPSGETGLARLVERTAFAGTENVGSKDWPSEKKAMDAVEEAYDKLEAERSKGPRAEEGRLLTLEMQVKMAIQREQSMADPQEYSRILQENGASGIAAATSADNTDYHYNLPSNRVELWFLMESQRLQHPVFRGFYRERQAVLDDYEAQAPATAQRQFLANFAAAAYLAESYRNPVLGWPSDVASLRISAAKRFFDKYYTPGNMVIAIVGDVQPAEVRRLADRYFGPLPARPAPPPVHTMDPPQQGPKSIAVISKGPSVLAIGFKRPDQYDRDDIIFDVLQVLLSNGRSGLLYKHLVQERRVAAGAQVVGSFPGARYPTLFTFLLTPAQGRTPDDNERALDEVLARLMTQLVTPDELARAKAQARAGVLRRLEDNGELARILANTYSAYGDWHRLYASVNDLNAVTATDVQRVAVRCFDPRTKTKAVAVRGVQ